MKVFFLAVFLLTTVSGYCNDPYKNQPEVEAFVKRIVKQKADFFSVEFIPAEDGKDVFELESVNSKIVLRGNKGTSIGSALNYYLREYCHCLITWNGVRMNLPEVLPAVKDKIRKTSPYQYRYYLNYCTFNYSMAWWDWERWQKEIDWMTLNGINMPLAITGEEAVWDKVYREMGFSQAQLDSFFCGPSYFAWFWMGNLDAWGGPLSANWMRQREALQKKILQAERAMGMTPVLPAFTGHVPPSFNTKFPSAKVKKTNWHSGFQDVLILDPSDALFDSIGQRFLRTQTKMFGTDHLYSADTFNENVPPTKDSSYLSNISRKIYTSMQTVDPEAVWVMQGWMFHYNSSYWQPQQMQALLRAVPDTGMIMLDLYSESYPMWKKTNAYYGKPWIWNMLHNFGGNISLWGRIDNAAKDPATALHDPASGKMIGIGLTPEGIEQNPLLYQLMLDNTWSDQPIHVDDWLKKYILQRYGAYSKELDLAWTLLAGSVYKGSKKEGGPESIITARPTLDSSNRWARTRLDYDPKELVKAWTLFVHASRKFQQEDGFSYDLVDITRQVLSNYALSLQQQAVGAFSRKNKKQFDEAVHQFLTLMDELDELLATRSDFLLGQWLHQARNNGVTPSEKDQYERNARNLITTWGDKDSPLHDYACRQWSGLIRDFYKPRWEYFFTRLRQSLHDNKPADFDAINEEIRSQEWNWVLQHKEYDYIPRGNAADIVNRLFRKYNPHIK